VFCQSDDRDVELLKGLMQQEFDTDHALLPELGEDMLLKPYKERAR
jgi:hypothetical protein